MKQIKENKITPTSMLAVIAVLLATLTVSFLISKLSSENQRYMLLNQQLQRELDKERQEKNEFAKEAREMERLLHNERRARTETMAPPRPYQQLYPELNVTRAMHFAPANPKVVYLTFNNGPFPMTESYLDLLKKHDVKATFFVFCGDDDASLERLKRIASEGHTLAPYTRSQECNKLYPSAEDFLHDFKRISDRILEATGEKPDILRFPGGSTSVYNKTVRQQIIAEMLRRGYTYYDWNIVITDEDGRQGTELAEESLLSELEKKQQKVIFMNDGSVDTLEVLEPLIIKLKKQGYKFERLTNKVEPVLLDHNPMRSQKPEMRQIS